MIPVPQALRRTAEEVDGWLDLNCPERALAGIETLLASPEGRRAGLAMRVRALVALSRHEQAISDIDELRACDEAQEWLDLCEAWCRKRLADLPGAIHCMEALVTRNPQSDIGHFNLACYLALAGDRDRAIDEVTIACGLTDEMRDFARDEPDLDGLRADPRFRALMRRAPRRPDPGGGAAD